MMRSMYSGISGIRAHQVKLDVVGNNIANVNTVGFKSSRVTFQEVLNQTIQPAFAASDDEASLGGMNAQQVGLGVSIGSIDVMHNPSGVQRTDRSFDVSVAQDGFFIVTNGVDTYYTRAGNFYLDGNGSLVTQEGYKVCDDNGDEIVISDAQSYTDFSINTAGKITAIDSEGEVADDLGTIGLAKFTNPQGLSKEGGNLYRETTNSGAPEIGVPGDEDKGLSLLIPGSLEMSNVDLSQEFTDMIIAQRGFQANARVITTSNELLQELAGIIR